jgi:hypothetical protein
MVMGLEDDIVDCAISWPSIPDVVLCCIVQCSDGRKEREQRACRSFLVDV